MQDSESRPHGDGQGPGEDVSSIDMENSGHFEEQDGGQGGVIISGRGDGEQMVGPEVSSAPTIDTVMDRIIARADEAIKQQKEHFVEIINTFMSVSKKVTIKSGNIVNRDESMDPYTEIIIDADVDLSRIYENNGMNLPLGLPTDTSLRAELSYDGNSKPVSRIVITIPVSAGVSDRYFKDSNVDGKVIHAIDEFYVRALDRTKQTTD